LKKRLNKRQRITKKDMNAMVDSFANGERITLEEFVQKFYSPKTPLAYMIAKHKASGFLFTALKRRFNKLGKDFGVVNNKGQFGIPVTEEEVTFRITNYYTLSKGINVGAKRAVNYASEQNMLPAMATERIALPKVA